MNRSFITDADAQWCNQMTMQYYRGRIIDLLAESKANCYVKMKLGVCDKASCSTCCVNEMYQNALRDNASNITEAEVLTRADSIVIDRAYKGTPSDACNKPIPPQVVIQTQPVWPAGYIEPYPVQAPSVRGATAGRSIFALLSVGITIATMVMFLI